MKKTFLITSALWILAIMIVLGVIYRYDDNAGIYKIHINRIQSRFGSDPETNREIIKSLTEEDKGMVSEVELIDLNHFLKGEVAVNEKTNETIGVNQQAFFAINDLDRSPAVYLPVEGSDYLAKYTIETASGRKLKQALLFCSIITIFFIIIQTSIYYIYRNIIEPMERVSSVPKQLAAGCVETLKVPSKNQYFTEFIWGLDMLREQLEEQKNRNSRLEKQRKTLVAGLSHDIKTPLSSIKNYAIALNEGIYEKAEEQDRALNIILDKVDVIEKLTRELLESSIQEINTASLKVELGEVYMSDIASRLNQIIIQKIELLHMDFVSAGLKEDLLVTADINALSQVFDNIIENAVKYGDLNRIEVNYHIEEYNYIISITNTGQPIAQNEI
ncbi:MAG: sensor histidine kinase, partial [Halanaerobiales bacterium]